MSALAPLTRSVPLLGRAGGNLRSSLVSYWRCDEASGTLVDALGRNDLTAVGSPTSAPGRVGTARQYVAASAQYHEIADNPSLSMGDIDFAIAAWVYLDSFSTANTMLAKWAGGSPEYWLGQYGGGKALFQVSPDGLTFPAVETSTLLLGVGAWHFVVAWHDAIANTLNIQVDNGTIFSAAHTTGVFDGTSPFTIGTDASYRYDGRLDEIAIWKGYIPSPAERTLLWNNGAGLTYPFVPSPAASLFQGLVSYWSLDEASGPALDSHGSNHLTAVGGPVSAPGRVGNARQFVAASSQYLEIASNPSLQMGPTDVTFACWVYLDDLSALYPFIGKASVASPEYALGYNLAPPRWSAFAAGDLVNFLALDTAGVITPTAGTWHFVVFTIDIPANETRIQIDNGPVYCAAATWYGAAGTAAFRIGSLQYYGSFMNGRIDELGYWKRVLTTTERAALWNLGAGTTYPFTNISTTPDPLLAGLVSLWNLDEEGGNAADSHGTNHLTQVNSPTSAPGKVGTARQLAAASSQHFTIPSNPSLQIGDVDLTVAVWAYFDSTAASVMLVTRDAPVGREYFIDYDAPSNRFRWVMWNASGNAEIADSASAGSILPSTWYFIVGWYEAATKTLHIQVNNGPVDSYTSLEGRNAPGAAAFQVGARNYPGFEWYFPGRLDEVGIRKGRVLTPAERTALWNAGAGRRYPYLLPPPSPLLTNLVSYWRLDEASGSALDVHGANHLTAVNGPTSAPGQVGTARKFVAASSQYFSIADNPDLSMGDIDFTIAGWLRADSLTTRAFVAKWASVGGNLEYWLGTYGGGKVLFQASPDGVAYPAVETPGGTLVIDTWYFVVAWHDATANTINLQVNNGLIYSFAHTTGVFSGTSPFTIGSDGTYPHDGRLDEIGIWKGRCLTPHERELLWNGGRGTTYPFLPPPPSRLLTDLVSYWRLDEGSGMALDAHGENHLTAINAPTSAAGKLGTARQLTGASSQYFQTTDNPSLDPGASSFTFSFWFNTDDLATTLSYGRPILSKYVYSNDLAYIIFFHYYARNLYFQVSADGMTGGSSVYDPQPLAANTWYFGICWYDAGAGTINVQINNGTVISAAHSGGIYDGVAPFLLGMQPGSWPWDGRLDEVGFWRRVLADVERTALWNGGAGRTYPFVGVS